MISSAGDMVKDFAKSGLVDSTLPARRTGSFEATAGAVNRRAPLAKNETLSNRPCSASGAYIAAVVPIIANRGLNKPLGQHQFCLRGGEAEPVLGVS